MILFDISGISLEWSIPSAPSAVHRLAFHGRKSMRRLVFAILAVGVMTLSLSVFAGREERKSTKAAERWGAREIAGFALFRAVDPSQVGEKTSCEYSCGNGNGGGCDAPSPEICLAECQHACGSSGMLCVILEQSD
jgi:hypothetical protein